MKRILNLILLILAINSNSTAQLSDLNLHPTQVVSRVYGDEKGSLFDWQYLTGEELVTLWSKNGLNGHKVYVNLFSENELEWRVSGWISSLDKGLAQGSVNGEGLRILTELSKRYILTLEGEGTKKKQAYFQQRPPNDVDYGYYAERGIFFFEVKGTTLTQLDDNRYKMEIDFEGPIVETGKK